MIAQTTARLRRPYAVFVVVAAACVAIACATTHNYLDPAGPMYEGDLAPDARDRTCGAQDGALEVVTFNIEFAREIERAIALLQTSAALRDVDILLLQEMDEPGVQRIALALGLNYVYIPSTVHPQAGHDFGTAVLSPWPLDEPRKMGSMFTKAGYRWLTDKLPGTSRGMGLWWSSDHVFARGFVPAGGGPSAGVVDSAGASDHRAVWVRVAFQNEK